GTDIAHRQVKDVRSDGSVSNTGSAGAHQDLCLRIFFADDLCKTVFHVGTDLDIGKSQTVVTVDGALDAARPDKRFFGTEENCLDRQQILGDLFL
ncbi:MAG: DUF1611 domain-containing protein, partial [Oscillospiraceae bacterium]|nr:DUF1611 domain-containing protein [Oscillospiraceae bacterium]